MDNHEASTLVQAHQPCPDCGSSDALSVYSDGHSYCFACQKHTQGDKQSAPKATQREQVANLGGLRTGEIRELKARNLSADTCKAFGYMVAPGIQIAPYVDELGDVVAQKLRGKDKSFGWTGNSSNVQLFGRQLWKGCDKRILVVTEGEIDAMSVYEVTKGTLPVVSLQNGAQSAVKSFKQSYDWLDSFETVVLCFDNDEPGIKAAKDAAQVLAPGKVKIVELPLKDANDMLKEGRTSELYTAIKNAKTYRPDGVILGTDMLEDVLAEDPESDALYPFGGLNKISRGLRFGELVTITAGIGTGKTSFITEIAYALQQEGHKVGLMLMEESVKHSARRLVGHHLNIPLQVNRNLATKEAIAEAYKHTVGSGNVVLYDHQGESDFEHLLSKVQYMIRVLGVRFVFIDNLTTIVSGLDERDERRAIDKIMKTLWQLAQREKVVIFLAVHLKRIEGNKGHEDGVQTSLSHLRGSQSIASNSNLVIGIERNQQDEATRNLATVRVLKNRLTGETGVACQLDYDAATGRLREAEGVSPFTPMNKPSEPNTDF